MSWFKKLELREYLPSPSLFYGDASTCRPRPCPFSSFLDVQEGQLGLAAVDMLSSPLDLPFHCPVAYAAPSPLDFFHSTAAAADLTTQIGGFAAYSTSLRRLQERAETESCLRSLCDRVTALELGFGRVLNPAAATTTCDRKYKWETVIQGPADGKGVDTKYEWVVEAKAGGERSLKCTSEVKGKGKDAFGSSTYTFQASTAPAAAATGKKVDAPVTAKKSTTRVVEITDGADRRAAVLRQAFARRAVSKSRTKELSPEDAALIIQIRFRKHLARRSQVLRGLRDLAVAKAKLREIRALFSNFSYRQHVSVDAEEHQKFSNKIIVLLLTVDAIEGPDYIVRATRRLMIGELKTMLEIVDPNVPRNLSSLKRRKL